MVIINEEMRKRAEMFILRWRGITTERAEAQTFTNEFFNVFGLDRFKLANFEKPIQKKDETGTGFADLFWSGKLIIESKSAHLDSPKHWDKTLIQAAEYIENLLPHQKPQFVLLMNFKRIKKYEVVISKTNKVKTNLLAEIPIEDLAEKLDEFKFFIEFANSLETDEEKVNQEAARLIANVYDSIERKGYESNDIAILLARILFCLFAEDTGIFESKQFEKFIREKTTGSNLGSQLLALFKTLNAPFDSRKATNVDLNKFPYVNGGLFDDKLKNIPHTTDAMKTALLNCCAYDWSDISPVIFGSLFQAVMDNVERRSLGAHYTSEKNILRVVKPLFLDKLHQEFDAINDEKSIENFRIKLNRLTFLDPACGCGNFLVVIYRELRLLDVELVRKKYIEGKKHKDGTQYITDSSLLNNVHLNNFYGYEIDSTSAMIASVAMWLTQHQMNMRLEAQFGNAIPTIPLHEAANIVNENSLHLKWEGNKKFIKGKGVENIVFDYIVGNPPFIGSKIMTQTQRDEVVKEFDTIQGAGVLDYVTAWYAKAAKYIQGRETKVAFVSTNSIVQGEQTSILWGQMLIKYNIKIHFAHRTFKWSNEAKGNAGVYCVIVGFANYDTTNKILYEYKDIKGEPLGLKVKNINPYLVDAKDIFIGKRRKPICKVPEISFGSMPNDGGNFLFTDEEKTAFIELDVKSKKFFKTLISAHEFLNGQQRWCLWLKDANPTDLKASKNTTERVENVRQLRLKSTRQATQKLAAFPTLFGEDRQPESNYVLIPLHSSENRKYIPIGFFDKNSIANNSCSFIPNAKLYHFGILMSIMHMAWVNATCGRLESRYRYSNELVYNNFPWPLDPTEKQVKLIEEKAQQVLDVRLSFPNSSLADLYSPLTMPAVLTKAHNELDKAVDSAYRSQPFISEAKRLEFLFELYEKYTSDLFTKDKLKKKK